MIVRRHIWPVPFIPPSVFFGFLFVMTVFWYFSGGKQAIMNRNKPIDQCIQQSGGFKEATWNCTIRGQVQWNINQLHPYGPKDPKARAVLMVFLKSDKKLPVLVSATGNQNQKALTLDTHYQVFFASSMTSDETVTVTTLSPGKLYSKGVAERIG